MEVELLKFNRQQTLCGCSARFRVAKSLFFVATCSRPMTAEVHSQKSENFPPENNFPSASRFCGTSNIFMNISGVASISINLENCSDFGNKHKHFFLHHAECTHIGIRILQMHVVHGIKKPKNSSEQTSGGEA